MMASLFVGRPFVVRPFIKINEHWTRWLSAAAGLLPVGAWLLVKYYLCAVPKLHKPQRAPGWKLEAGNDEALVCVQINVWSGSTYELEPVGAGWPVHLLRGRFGSHETPAEAAERYTALVAQLKRLKPAVVSLNEARSAEWVRQLADELGLVAIYHSGISVVRMGPLTLPLGGGIEEGDALLLHPELVCEAVARKRLTGQVFGQRLAFNLGDATQALGVRVRTPSGQRLLVVSTHWRATPIEDAEAEAGIMAQITDAREREEARRVLRASTKGRLEECRGTLALLRALRSSDKDVPAAVVMGDLNSTPNTLEVQTLLARGDLHDPLSSAPTIGGGVSNATWDPIGNPNVRRQLGTANQTNSLAAAASAGAPERGVGGLGPPAVERNLKAASDRRQMRLDYILTTKSSLEVQSCAVVMDSGGNAGDDDASVDVGGMVVPSDHYGLFARVKFRPRF